MTRLSLPRRPCSVGAATVAVAVLSLSVPSPALADPADGGGRRVDVGAARNRIDPPVAERPGSSVDFGAARNRIDLPAGEVRRLLDQIERGTATSASTNAPAYRRPTPASGPNELLQTAVGFTAVATLLSGAALMGSRRRRSVARAACPGLRSAP